MEPASPPGIDYPRRVQAALLRVVREVLAEVARDGLPGEHHFFLTFRTTAPGVELPASLLMQYPEQMTVVLENQFWGLEVDEERFSVTLRFSGQPTRLSIPFTALSAFVDPHASFGLSFTPEGSEEPDAEPVTASGEPEPATPLPDGGNVVAFRRPTKKS
jgi:uncharacterized protein